jgi:WD40 repeat protein
MRFGIDRFRHEGGVPGALVFTSDGKGILAACERGSALYWWDSSTGKLIGKEQFESNLLRANLILSADGKRVAFSDTRDITVWDLPLNKQRPLLKVRTDPVARSVFTRDGGALLIAEVKDESAIAQFWDLKTGKLQKAITLEKAPVEGPQPAPRAGMAGGPLLLANGQREFLQKLDISPDGQVIIGVSLNGPARFWDSNGRRLATYPQDALSFAFSPDGKTLAYANADGVILWDRAAQKRRTKLEVEEDRARVLRLQGMPVAFSADSRYLAASWAGKVVVWEVASAKELLSFSDGGVTGGGIIRAARRILCFGPDGKSLVEFSENAVVRMWDLESGKEKLSEVGHRSAITELAFSPDGSKLATAASQDTEVRTWDVASGAPNQVFNERMVQVRGLLFSPDGQSLIAGGSSIAIWNAASGENLHHFGMPPDPNQQGPGQIQSLALQPDGVTLTVLAVRYGGFARAGAARAAARNPANGPDAARGMRGGAARGRAPGIAPVSNTVRTVTWDLFTGKQLSIREDVSEDYVRMLLSPDASLRASFNGLVCNVQDVKSGKQVATLDSDGHSIYLVAFSPDSQKVAALCTFGMHESVVAVWCDIKSGKELGRIRLPTRIGQTSDGALHAALAFSPDSKIFATGAQASGGIQLWDASNGKEIGRFTGYGDTVTALKFAPDGRQLASGLVNGLILLWDVDKAALPPVISTKPASGSLPPFRKPLADAPARLPGAAELIRQLLEEARQQSEKIEPMHERVRLLTELAVVQGQAGTAQEKASALDAVRKLIAALAVPQRRGLLQESTRTAALAGGKHEARALLAELRALDLANPSRSRPPGGDIGFIQALARAGLLDEALELFKPNPDDEDPEGQRGILRNLAATHFAVEGDLTRALALVEAIPNPVFRFYALVGNIPVGNMQVGNNRLANTQARWNDSLPASPGGIAMQLLAAGKNSAAEQVIKKAEQVTATIEPPAMQARCWSIITCCWARLGNLQAAEAALTKVPQDAELRPYALMGLARARAQAGDGAAARQIVDQLKGRLQGEAFYELALGQLDHGDREAALESCDKSWELVRGFVFANAALMSIARVRIHAQDFQGAVALVEANRSPNRRASEFGVLAQTQAQIGDFAAALETIDQQPAEESQSKTTQLRKLARAQTEHNREQDTLSWVRKRENPEERAFALLGVAEGLLKRR